MISKIKPFLFFAILFFIIFAAACRKDKFLTDGASLEFSNDTLTFDTVFRYAGSTTKQFRLYNNNKQPIKISSVYLAGGESSPFRINLDGISNVSFTDVEVPANDSLFIFVQVSVSPSQSNPLLIKDSVVFETDGNTQNVKLVAIGQDVYLHKPDLPKIGVPYYSIMGREGKDTILPNDKPHLFFGYTVIDSACKLTIPAGTHLYFHNKAVLWVYKAGTLIVNGAYKNEVTFQGDRLESYYKDVAGQWGKIWFSKGSLNNRINWAIIKNGSIGVQADTVVTPSAPTVLLTNTIIKNMQAAAIYGLGARIWGTNCVFSNCGQYIAAFTIGGSYRFEQCTFANYWSDNVRTTPLLALNNYYTSANNLYVIRNLDSAYFGNCILMGDIDEEIGMDSSIYGGKFSYKFENCIIKTARSVSNAHYKNVYNNADPSFKDIQSNDYHLNSSSAAIDKGYPNTLNLDLENKARPNPAGTLPDLGAYEYYP
ncbi:MAG TPA: choice-of-anchor Q domain-containing protein [Bacteroidia bacterium]|jgi:hypothetical protein|nr:choice-of-anchor Q domain-containing protein [Bacteroidia bacterium]